MQRFDRRAGSVDDGKRVISPADRESEVEKRLARQAGPRGRMGINEEGREQRGHTRPRESAHGGIKQCFSCQGKEEEDAEADCWVRECVVNVNVRVESVECGEWCGEGGGRVDLLERLWYVKASLCPRVAG
jgi:hypothetical protein